MACYIAFLRGISPVNAKGAQLIHAFEEASFTEVKTVLSSGNVVFTSSPQPEAKLAQQTEETLFAYLGRRFLTIVLPLSILGDLVEADPYTTFELPVNAKRIVTFLSEPQPAKLSLPIEVGDERMLTIYGNAVLSIYLPRPRNSMVMTRIEKIFGSKVTTRTWETVKKCVIA